MNTTSLFGIAVLSSGLLVLCHPLQAQIIYQDSFNRSGDLNGSAPDLVDAGSGAWTTSLSNIYTVTSGTVSINPAAYTYQGAYLPVNNNGSDKLTGLQNFTLSATVTAGSEGTDAGIALLDGPIGSYSGFDSDSLASIESFPTFGEWYYEGNVNYDFSATGASPTATLISIVYNASAGTLTYNVGANVIGMETGVTASQITSLTDVSFGFGGNNTPQTATVESFQLSVAQSVPEASTLWACGIGMLGLLSFHKVRRNRTVRGPSQIETEY